MKRIDLTGDRYGRWRVLRFSHKNKYGHINWRCICDCGTIKTVSGNSMRQGKTRSCGCLRNEVSSSRKKHGMIGTSIYRIWAHMIERCTNSNCKDYINYGGRGISVSDEWRNDFMAFYTDMGDKPIGLSIDRINNDGNYETANCRWATRKEQSNNTRRNVKMEEE